MLYKALKSKIHMARVTDAQVDYPGSIYIDSELMKEIALKPYEAVIVADVTNGARLETYAIPAEAGSGKIKILGAAAKLVNPDDRVIIMNYGYYHSEEMNSHKPNIIVVDSNNKIVKRV